MVSVQILHHPTTGAGQCSPAPGKESSMGRRSKGTGQLRNTAESLSPARKASPPLSRPTWPSKPQRNEWWARKLYFSPRARGRVPWGPRAIPDAAERAVAGGEGRSGAARPCHGHTHLPAHPAALPLAPRCPLPRPTLPPHPLPPRKRLCRTKGRVSWSP